MAPPNGTHATHICPLLSSHKRTLGPVLSLHINLGGDARSNQGSGYARFTEGEWVA